MSQNYTPEQNRLHNRRIAAWLFVCCLMVYAMVILGGVTRLTGSGLSMVEWDPIFGILPPLDQASWNETFTLYQQSPEYQKINIGMDLAGFKQIYWFEYSHRVLGRTIGTVFLLPFLFFLVKGWVQRPLIPKLLTMFVLGGLQGLLGWYMVKSGLVDNPHVSQYRLTAHLGLAILIYVYMFYIALGLWLGERRSASVPGGLRRATTLLTGLMFITILSGGFVAGLKAGYAYNTFPLMDGHWIPEVIFMQTPLWRNFFENIATVQFDHRLLATLVFFSVIVLWMTARRYALPAAVKTGLHLMLATVFLQVGLGISTLLLHVPVSLATTHQAGALLLLTIALYTHHRMTRAA
ncbi:MAG: heme A synthase [Gammaproteobacteria bacterium]|nr:MAG: heme A synthase [Gammaproteobacteria bacterium]